MMIRRILFALVLLATTVAAQPALAAATVYVMRHLQKADGSDPPLSAEGAANARALAQMLGRSGIKAIFATPTRRAMETGAPLAAKLGIAVTPYDPSNPNALVAAVDAVKGPALVVGHSNTVPDLVTRFGGKRAITLSDQDYGTVFVVANPGGSVSELKIGPAR